MEISDHDEPAGDKEPWDEVIFEEEARGFAR